MKKIFEFLKDGFDEVSSALDLSFDDDSVADEKIPFLAYLASFLKDNKTNPCEPPAGCLNFRNLVAEFMKSYYNIPLTSDVRLLSCVRLYQKFIGSTYLPLLSYASYDPPFFFFFTRMLLYSLLVLLP